MRLLDLFCGAGGAAVGYSRAGFEVVGVDISPQPRYPFEFIQADAMEFPLEGFYAIHASPPCQAYASLASRDGRHPDLIEPIREALQAAGKPYVIENIEIQAIQDQPEIPGQLEVTEIRERPVTKELLEIKAKLASRVLLAIRDQMEGQDR